MNTTEAYILQLINEAPSAKALIARIKDDPRDGAGYGLGPKTAQAVLALRDEKGGFKSLNELLEVSGFGENKLRDFIHSFEGDAPIPPQNTDGPKGSEPPPPELAPLRQIKLNCRQADESLDGFELHLQPLSGTPPPRLANLPIPKAGMVVLEVPYTSTPLRYKAYLINPSGNLRYSYRLSFPPAQPPFEG